MKKLLLIVGIVSIIACVFALLFAALSCIGYYHLMDGSAELYSRLHGRMVMGFISGSVFAAIGIVCLMIRSKM